MFLTRILCLCAAASLLLAGCSTWYNPNLVDQANHDALLEKDYKFCDSYTLDQMSTAPINSQQYPTVGMRQEVEDYQVSFTERQDQDSIFLQCMKSRGWQRK